MVNFSERRKKVFEAMADNSVLLVFSGRAKVCSEDESFPFVCNKNFFYLTGIEQENSALILINSVGGKKEYLFVDEYDEVKEKWTGKRLAFEEARKIADIKNVQSTNTFNSMLELALAKTNNVYGAINKLYLDLSPELKIGNELSTVEYKKIIESKLPHVSILNAYPIIKELRMVKDQFEIENLYEAINLTNLGLADLILNLHAGEKEHELSDRFEFYGRSHSRHKLAFSTITAAGMNGVILHHPIEQQNERIKEEDLILFDLGFSHNGYSADVSRTYPVSGKFNPLQEKIYSAVLKCNKAVIDYIRPGLTINDLQEFALADLRESCILEGLMAPEEEIKKYYYHNISHFLGLDTHDVGSRDIPLKPGHVITVEPGLYFKEHGIGVRIEDDVLITDKGCVVLTKDIKKEIADIEKMFRGKKR